MKKFFSLVLALVIALSLTTVAWGAGATLEVGAGKTYTTIQAAVNAAGSTDTIKVAAGTYDAFYIPDDKDGLTIEGTVEGGVLKTIVRTLYDTSPTFASNRCGGINIDAADVTLKNLAIQSEGYTNGRWYAAPIGHYYENTSDRSGLTVEGCTITNMAASKSGIAICVNIADITLEKNVITGYDTGWRAESGLNLDTVVVEGNTFNVNSCAVEFVNSGTPETGASVSITGNNFNGGDVIIWDYANTKDYSDSAIENVTLSGNTYGAGSDVILYDFKGGQADDEIQADKAPVETYGTLANAVRLNPDATEVTLHYGTASEVTYTEQSNGTWLGDNNTQYDAAGGNPKTVVAKVGNTTYETLAAAIAAANGAPIVLLDTSVTIPAGYTVATDVNGNLVVIAGTNAPASGAKGAYYTTDLTNLAVYPSCDLTNYNYTLETYTVAADAAKTFAKVAIWQTHKVSGAKTIVYTAVVASADSANLAFVNGASITYLNTNVAKWTATATEVATVDVEDAEKCGDMFIAGDVGVYTDANGKVYYENIGGVAYNVGGKLVMLKEAAKAYPVVDSAALKAAKTSPAAGTVYTVKHDYDVDVKTFNSDKTITRVFCAECKAEFAFVEGTVEDAIKKFGAGNYTLETIDNMPVYVALTGYSAGGTTTPSTDKVTSAETFDAGIAMYVGMSVMAAAGSAVVIGKKKD